MRQSQRGLALGRLPTDLTGGDWRRRRGRREGLAIRGRSWGYHGDFWGIVGARIVDTNRILITSYNIL